MSQQTQQEAIARKRVVYTMPGVEAVTVRRDETYRVTDAGALTMDVYYPPGSTSGARLPAVVFVLGYNDAGAQRMLGCRFKEMGSFVSWAHLAAASGIVAITYTNREPLDDVNALLDHVRQNAASLGIDETRIGVWACSGHVPLTLSLLMQPGVGHHLKCAVLCYGYMLDVDGFTGVAQAARQFGFVTPPEGTSVDDLSRDVPLFVARAGQDQLPHLKEAMDRFVVKALGANLPLTFVNHADAPHAFDVFHDSDASREIIRQMLTFMRFHLGAS